MRKVRFSSPGLVPGGLGVTVKTGVASSDQPLSAPALPLPLSVISSVQLPLMLRSLVWSATSLGLLGSKLKVASEPAGLKEPLYGAEPSASARAAWSSKVVWVKSAPVALPTATSGTRSPLGPISARLRSARFG